MKSMTIKRVSHDNDGTYGVLIDNTTPFAVTLEPSWNENKTNVSCIPAGTYTCKRINSPKFGNTFEIIGVPNRTHILFHKGNTIADSKGCPLIAENFGKLKDKTAILYSKKGFSEFMNKLVGINEFLLTIIWV